MNYEDYNLAQDQEKDNILKLIKGLENPYEEYEEIDQEGAAEGQYETLGQAAAGGYNLALQDVITKIRNNTHKEL